MNRISPKVSVVIPTRNRAHLLKRALESVFRQSYENMEVVVLDDCSEDDTPQVISSFRERYSNLRAFREASGSITKAIQNVTKKAEGKYIARLDDDDFWSDPEKTAVQAAFLEKHPDYVAVGGGVIRVDSRGQERARYLLPETDRDIRRVMLWYIPMPGVVSMYRRSALEEVGGFDVAVIYANDWDIVARLGTVGKLYNFRRYLATYTKEDVRWSPATARRLESAAFLVRRRHRAHYPGFWEGCLFGAVLYLSTFVPFWRVWRPFASRAWNSLRTKFLT